MLLSDWRFWADAGNLFKGHWLMGRMGQGNLGDIINDIVMRAGVENCDFSGVYGIIDGLILEGNNSARNALEGLLTAFGIDINETETGLRFKTRQIDNIIEINPDDLLFDDDFQTIKRSFEDYDDIKRLMLSCYSVDSDYDMVGHNVYIAEGAGKITRASLPIIADWQTRDEIGKFMGAIANISKQKLEINLGIDTAINLLIGDIISINGEIWRVESLERNLTAKVTLSKAVINGITPKSGGITQKFVEPISYSRPYGFLLSLPYPFIQGSGNNAIAYAAQSPFFGNIDFKIDGSPKATIQKTASYGYLIGSLPQSRISQALNMKIQINLVVGDLPDSGNLAIITSGVIDIISYSTKELIAEDTYELGGIVRGLNGYSDVATIAEGATLLLLDDAGTETVIANQYIGIDYIYNFTTNGMEDADGYTLSAQFSDISTKIFAPCHLKAIRKTNGIEIGFIRRARGNGDGWEGLDVPNQIIERYRVEILDASNVAKRTINTDYQGYLYPNADEIADFGNAQSQIKFRVAQIGDDNILGWYNEAQIVV